MPRGLIRVCSWTGLPLKLMREFAGDLDTDADGNLVPDIRQPYDLRNVRTMAGVAGFDDWRYFVRSVMHSGFFHWDKVELLDNSGRVISSFLQTCVATVEADKLRYREHMRQLQAVRNRRAFSDVSSSDCLWKQR